MSPFTGSTFPTSSSRFLSAVVSSIPVTLLPWVRARGIRGYPSYLSPCSRHARLC
jgi:hypothetical protein